MKLLIHLLVLLVLCCGFRLPAFSQFTMEELLGMMNKPDTAVIELVLKRGFKEVKYSRDKYWGTFNYMRISKPEEGSEDPVKRSFGCYDAIYHEERRIIYTTTSLTEYDSMQAWAGKHGYRRIKGEPDNDLQVFSNGKNSFQLLKSTEPRTGGGHVRDYTFITDNWPEKKEEEKK